MDCGKLDEEQLAALIGRASMSIKYRPAPVLALEVADFERDKLLLKELERAYRLRYDPFRCFIQEMPV